MKIIEITRWHDLAFQLASCLISRYIFKPEVFWYHHGLLSLKWTVTRGLVPRICWLRGQLLLEASRIYKVRDRWSAYRRDGNQTIIWEYVPDCMYINMSSTSFDDGQKGFDTQGPWDHSQLLWSWTPHMFQAHLALVTVRESIWVRPLSPSLR